MAKHLTFFYRDNFLNIHYRKLLGLCKADGIRRSIGLRLRILCWTAGFMNNNFKTLILLFSVLGAVPMFGYSSEISPSSEFKSENISSSSQRPKSDTSIAYLKSSENAAKPTIKNDVKADIKADIKIAEKTKIIAWNSEDREGQYQSLQENYFQPFYDSSLSQHLTLRDGYEINHRYYENPNAKGSIVIIQGRTETTFKYAEQIYDFYHMGYSVYVFDSRGQGYSKHLVEGHPTFGHIENFNDYVDDLREYLDKVVLNRKKGKLLAYCHSMGAAVGALFELKYPGAFDGYVWQSPMFEINTRPFPYWAARMIVGTMDLFGRGTSLPPLQKDFHEDEKNNVTSSEVRRNYVFKQRIKERSALIGPATAGWANQALIATRVIANHSNQLRAPVLVLEAGKDEYVNSEGIKKVCQKAQSCQKIVFEAGMHELYLENDSIRRKLLDEVDHFFAKL